MIFGGHFFKITATLFEARTLFQDLSHFFSFSRDPFVFFDDYSLTKLKVQKSDRDQENLNPSLSIDQEKQKTHTLPFTL